MKLFLIFGFYILSILSFSCFNLSAQESAGVTIGSNELSTNIGSLLDVKEKNPDANSINFSKGILLPRVSLTDTKSLIGISQTISEADNTSNIGLMVFNINSVQNTATSTYLYKGIYVWDGTSWIYLHKRKLS